jgi:integrase
MAINLLEATQIINMPLGIPGKPAKLFDGGGLYIENSFGGTKAWRVRVRKDGRDTAVSLGVFPALSLKAARAAARAVLSDSPAAALAPAAPAGKTFREVALMYHANGSKSWAAGTATEILRSLEARVFPVIGDTLIATLTPLKVMEAITPIESPKVAHKVRQRIAAVFSYADALDLLPGKNPAANLARVMEAPAKGGNRPAVLDLAAARAVIAVSESAAGQATTRLAARFLALTAQRPGEVRNAEWSEMKRDFQIDGIPAPHWHIPAAKMKARKQHFVPLSVQALEVLAEI